MSDSDETEISVKIRGHKAGKISDDELIQYLTHDVKYKPANVNPYEPGTGAWFLWSEGGKPFVPGSFQEVVNARDTGLLSPAVFNKVMSIFHSRMSTPKR